MSDRTREELYRRLEQSRRLSSTASDALTRDRIQTLISELERQIAAAEARGADAPTDGDVL